MFYYLFIFRILNKQFFYNNENKHSELLFNMVRHNGNKNKAFDRVTHSMLFTKLLRRGAPGYIVRLLMFWCAHQTMCVRWGSSVSYRNLQCLMGSGKGEFCHRFCVYGICLNHLMYADDIVLLTPSATGLSLLLHVC